ncbi:MAG TPA: flagellar biosynthesis protein FlhA [Candidatus Kapabacteria bacterium]|nr:flagellar biosynthesis protein FlhA [Candidatus Kapabacteria bacterium]
MAKRQQMALTGNVATTSLWSRIAPYLSKSPELVLAGGILMILGLLVLPLPPFLLDVLLALNLSISVLIIIVSIYLTTPLDFSSFPTILLLTTMFRLGLNVASTRLILGEAQAGEIIQAFGTFVIKGNYVVGIIIFLILLVINFIVVIKGSTRIAEVAARFTLDALPGKQMSIDADLNAGYIDEITAKNRRESLTKESDFYGAMDGAAKFIRGDAIAGLIITAINILGGFTIGIAQRGMDFTESISLYTILTIGDGLVSQIPSLLISVAAGLVVTRSASADKLDVELMKQFSAKPRALGIASAAMLAFALIPGFPAFPFLLLASVTGTISYLRNKSIKKAEAMEQEVEMAELTKEKKPEEQPVEELLRVDPVEIELGYSLISLVDESQGGDVFKRITNVRRQLAIELGIILPPVRVRDNLQNEPEEYVIRIRGNEIARNVLHPNMLLAMNPGTAEGEIGGIKVTEPVFGLPATWVTFGERENAEILGYTVVEAATVLTTHLTELLRRNSDRLLTRQDVKQLVENLKTDYPSLVEEVTPEHLHISILQKVLQNLLKEGIPIRDLAIIIESLLEYVKVTKNVDVLTEYVRHNLSETIKKMYHDSNGVIHAISVDQQLEQTMTTSLQTSSQASISPTLGLSIEVIRGIQKSISEAIDDATIAGYLPIIICSAQIRPYFYRMIHNQFPMVSVISYTELPSDTDINIVASVKL